MSAFPVLIISGRHVMHRQRRSGHSGLCVHSSFIQVLLVAKADPVYSIAAACDKGA